MYARVKFGNLYLFHNDAEQQFSVFTHRLCCCCCLVRLLMRSLDLKAISTCWKKEHIGIGQTGVAMMNSCSHCDQLLA